MATQSTVKLLVKYLLILVISSDKINGQDADCDYFQNIQLGLTYYVYSKNFPGLYGPGKTCRWQAQCPANTICRINCPEVNIPESFNCVNDRLLISLTGDSALTGADKYCGRGSINLSSSSNRLSIGFISTSNSNGGRFLCELTAQQDQISTNCECGWKFRNRIVGGQETGVNEFPMMAGLVDITLVIIYCGSTIISDNWVLTAAHCLQNQDTNNVAVLVGEHNIKLSDSPATKLIRASRFVSHPNFNGGRDFDIGLIQTSERIEFNERVGPACLPFKYRNTDFVNTKVEALGWGSRSFGGQQSDYLEKVTLDVISIDTCNNQWGSVVANNDNLCTFTQGKDTCQFDSGGPILYTESNTGRVFLVGVAIGGFGCATTRPGLNTRVSQFMDWIVSTTGATFCRK